MPLAINPQRVALVDPKTGLICKEWMPFVAELERARADSGRAITNIVNEITRLETTIVNQAAPDDGALALVHALAAELQALAQRSAPDDGALALGHALGAEVQALHQRVAALEQGYPL